MFRYCISSKHREFPARQIRWGLLVTAAGVFMLSSGCFNGSLKNSVGSVSATPGTLQNPHISDWVSSGHDLGNTRNQPNETILNTSNVSQLSVKWVFTSSASVSVTPTVTNGQLYFPDWAGNLYDVDASTGKLVWQTQISSYTGIAQDVSRTSPAVYGNELIFGDNLCESGPHDGARLIAVDRNTGKLLWATQIDKHPAAVITGPAVVYNGVVYQGVGSAEEQYATDPKYPCCTFRGSMVAVDANTGRILWRTYTVPDNGGDPTQYSGNAIWQPPVIDTARGSLYVGTGNNYTAPASVEACQLNNPKKTDCAAPDDYFETVLAMDLQTGSIQWATRLYGWDAWTVACLFSTHPSACPKPPGPDYDFGGSGGNLMGSVVGFGQKSGMYWALNTSNGSILWATQAGPGGNLGGILWGSATDGSRVYVPITNNEHFNYILANGQTITGSAWVALHPASGNILWQTLDPAQGLQFNMGAVSVANGVMYSGAMDGHMYAFDASNGKILWSYEAAGTILDGPAIVNGVIYWGSGYARSGGTPDSKVYAFALPGS